MVLMKIENIQEMFFIDKTNKWLHDKKNSSKWYHISTRGINHIRRWFHKWSSTLSDHQVKKVPSPTRAQVYQVDDPCYDIEGGAPPISIKVKDPIWGISRATSGVIPSYMVVSIKYAKFKPQPSTPMQSFVSIRCTPFIEIDDKGGEVGTKIWNASWGRSGSWTWIKREQHWRMEKDQNFWTREAHK